jgi:hypothetical protein
MMPPELVPAQIARIPERPPDVRTLGGSFAVRSVSDRHPAFDVLAPRLDLDLQPVA